jgi:quercetin dioxygenase-like cupin family protein
MDDVSSKSRLTDRPARRYLWCRFGSEVRQVLAENAGQLPNRDTSPMNDSRRRSPMDSHAAGSFVRAPAAGSVLNVLGITHTYKAMGTETAGSFSLWEAVFPPGAGAPPHIHHREDEAFYVLSGELVIEFEGGAAPHRLTSGGFFFGARGQRHSVRNVSDEPARVLVLGVPSLSLDQMFAELDATTVGSGVPELRTLAAICARHGVTIEPPTA